MIKKREAIIKAEPNKDAAFFLSTYFNMFIIIMSIHGNFADIKLNYLYCGRVRYICTFFKNVHIFLT